MPLNGFPCERLIGKPLFALSPYVVVTALSLCWTSCHGDAYVSFITNCLCSYREVGGRSAAIEDSDRIVLFEDIRDYLFLFSDERLKLEVELSCSFVLLAVFIIVFFAYLNIVFLARCADISLPQAIFLFLEFLGLRFPLHLRRQTSNDPLFLERLKVLFLLYTSPGRLRQQYVVLLARCSLPF
jgi:hypothetical protein